MTMRAATARVPVVAPALVEARGLVRTFDLSPPLLDRVVNRAPRRVLRAVDNVSFSIEKGSTLALVGESGSGKSTVARMAVGLLPPSAGSIFFDGEDVGEAGLSRASPMRRRVSMVFQNAYGSLDPRMTAGAIIAEPVRAFGLAKTRSEVDARVDELLAKVGLPSFSGARYPHQLSGGQRQRVAIARALASEPDFIACDEPTSALDVSVQAQILNLLLDLQSELDLTYLLISHNLALVRFMASTVGVMYLGRIVEMAPAETLFEAPRHPYTQMLLGSVPRLDGRRSTSTAPKGESPSPMNPPKGCAFHPRCPMAVERCRIEVPPTRRVGTADVACHLA